jgi:hypothetical protein
MTDAPVALPAASVPYSAVSLRADYAAVLLASIFYGAPRPQPPLCRLRADARASGVYLLMCVVIFAQIGARRRKVGCLNTPQRSILLFTLGMLAATTGWYVASAMYNAALFGGGIVYLSPAELEARLGLCNTMPIVRDVFRSLQILGADGLLVGVPSVCVCASTDVLVLQLWRTFVVWDRSWVMIIPPLLLYLAVLGTPSMRIRLRGC